MFVLYSKQYLCFAKKCIWTTLFGTFWVANHRFAFQNAFLQDRNALAI